jgi:hypothetical protein
MNRRQIFKFLAALPIVPAALAARLKEPEPLVPVCPVGGYGTSTWDSKSWVIPEYLYSDDPNYRIGIGYYGCDDGTQIIYRAGLPEQMKEYLRASLPREDSHE